MSGSVVLFEAGLLYLIEVTGAPAADVGKMMMGNYNIFAII